jgi:hypothetical protein
LAKSLIFFFFIRLTKLPQNNEFAVFEDLASRYEVMVAALLQLCQDQRAWEFLGRQSRDFQSAVRYLLPELLLEPLYHVLHYNEVLELMLKKTPDADVNERANFRSVWFFFVYFCPQNQNLTNVTFLGVELQASATIKRIALQLNSKRKPFIENRPSCVWRQVQLLNSLSLFKLNFLLLRYLKLPRSLSTQAQHEFRKLQLRITDWDGPELATISSRLICPPCDLFIWNERVSTVAVHFFLFTH